MTREILGGVMVPTVRVVVGALALVLWNPPSQSATLVTRPSVDAAAYAEAHPSLGPEVGSVPVFVPAIGEQEDADAAFAGSSYLVVWEDERDLGSSGVWATRVDEDGTVLDQPNLHVRSGLDARRPAVASAEDLFFVVWVEGRGDGSMVLGTRLDLQGRPLDAAPIEISRLPEFARGVTVASSPEGFFVAWEDFRTEGGYSSDLFGARVAPDGTLLDENPIQLSSRVTVGGDSAPDVVWTGDHYLVVWQAGVQGRPDQDIVATRVRGGEVLDPEPFAVASAPDDQRYPSVAHDGAVALVAWEDERNHSTTVFDVYGARIDDRGIVLDPQGIPIATQDGWEQSPSVTSDGSGFAVVWEEVGETDVAGKRVSSAGVPELEPHSIEAGSESASHPVIIAGPTRMLVAWHAVFAGEIAAKPVSPSLDPAGQETMTLSVAAEHQMELGVASGGQRYLMVWADEHLWADLPRRVAMTLVESDGTEVARKDLGEGVHPATGWNGRHYLVAWVDDRGIVARRIAPDGRLLDQDPLEIHRNFNLVVRGVSVVPYPNGFLIAYSAYNAGVRAVRVANDGTVVDRPPIVVDDGYSERVDAAWDGRSFLVTWRGDGIQSALLDTAGRVRPAVRLAPDPAIAPMPAVAGHEDGGFYVAWRDATPEGFTIRGVPVSAAGAVERQRIATIDDVRSQDRAIVMPGERGFVIVWRRSMGPHLYELRAVRATSEGALGEETRLTDTMRTRGAFDLYRPALVGTTSTTGMTLGYRRFALEDPYGGAERFFFRTLDASEIPRPPRCPAGALCGTAGNDILRGTARPDRIYGFGGSDRLIGRGGRDVLVGGAGHDRVRGNRGHDRLWGGKHRDRLNGGAGRDRCRGGSGPDVLERCEL